MATFAWPEQRTSVVGADVLAALENGGRHRVFVALKRPVGVGRGSAILDHRGVPTANYVDEIRRIQDAVLGRLRPGDFSLGRRFRTLASIVGEASRNGIVRLAMMPEVRRIDLDVGGTGHLDSARVLTRATQLTSAGYTGDGVTVAVLDSGIDTDHPDLAAANVAEACFCSGSGGCCPDGSVEQHGSGSAEDDNGHGTNVTGIVTSDGTVAPEGVAPDADIVSVKVLDSNNGFCCTSDIVAGLDYLITEHPEVKVINMSLGTFARFEGDCDNASASNMALAEAINTLNKRKASVFASAGNDNSAIDMTSPACVKRAVSTAAVYDGALGRASYAICTDADTQADQVTCFSNTNNKTDILAPGARVSSTGLASGISNFFGTSQASPHAAACAAAIYQAQPQLKPKKLEKLLEKSGTMVTDDKNGEKIPRIDCYKALESKKAQRPKNLAGVVNGNAVSLTWKTRSGPSDHIIEVGTAPGDVDVLLMKTGSKASAYTIESLIMGTYFFRVRSVKNGKISSTSKEVVVTVS